MFRRLLLLVVTAGYAWVVWRMTLTPQLFSRSGSDAVALVLRLAQQHAATAWVTYDRAEFMANIAMFVPVGAIAAMWLPRRAWFLAGMLAVGLSVGIEWTQHVALPGRVADPRDVLSNGLGGFLGATLIGLARSAVPERRRRRPRMV
ncbi:VanZ family protein [Curtobacterium sp. MCBD17_013]|uniref:VanZ family protein n=1 Tax=unclassified Curtobacterium TaxID=257496 RepID=UPI000DA7D9D3|nr:MULTISPECIES: VanZ family protein [unclassified Curtobacterium]PZF60524.1 VanZ family protein [Curtobacterium sp. MCBD17_013]WIB64453.1 VanZ family protein [Curtobacterium sp. MCBD17_040]WIB68293.1 VanZ family protein [Curtobacterium sp. MCBD17_035]